MINAVGPPKLRVGVSAHYSNAYELNMNLRYVFMPIQFIQRIKLLLISSGETIGTKKRLYLSHAMHSFANPRWIMMTKIAL